MDLPSDKLFRPSWIEIDLDAISENVRQIRHYLGPVRLLSVVKADAYGAGAVPSARVIRNSGADYLGVVTLEEAIELREAGIGGPMLNLAPILPQFAPLVIHYDIDQVVFEPELATALSRASAKEEKPARVHLKIDTGMSRYGVKWDEAVSMYRQLAGLPGLQFVGAMSHFPNSDGIDKSFALLQLHRMREIKAALGNAIPLWHLCNSGGALDLPQAHMEMVRIGIMNYGYYPSKEVSRPFVLQPAMQVKTQILSVKTIQRGETVGYGRRFMAEQEERIGVLPIGYADGYDRKLRNIGQVLINGKRVPIVGGLCMDACFIKITDFPEAVSGTAVTIMGKDGDQEISPHDIANLIDSVSYEVICRWGKRLPRFYKQNGRYV